MIEQREVGLEIDGNTCKAPPAAAAAAATERQGGELQGAYQDTMICSSEMAGGASVEATWERPKDKLLKGMEGRKEGEGRSGSKAQGGAHLT